MRPIRSAIVLALLLTAAACGDAGEPAATTTTAAGAPSTTAAAQPASGCTTTPFTGSVAREASGDHAAVSRDGGAMIDSVAAVRSEGIAYTIYLADYQIDNDDVGGTLRAPAGSVLVTMAIDQIDGIVVGQPFANTEEQVPFVIIDSGGGPSDTSSGASGSITVTGLDADSICFDIVYEDNIKSITGSVSAEVVPAF